MNKLSICILANETVSDSEKWIISCDKRSREITYDVVDLCAWNWLEQIRDKNYDFYLTKPGGMTQGFKQLYDERLGILCNELGCKVFPTYKEVQIYENKRYLSFWLKANHIPHPGTEVFYCKAEVLEWLKQVKYPLVGKINIGASGSGVTFLTNHKAAREYVSKAFSSKGIRSRWYPNLHKGHIFFRLKRALQDKGLRKKRLQGYKSVRQDRQRNFVILQDYIEHDYEWRVVRMGDSFFAHKKLKMKEKASGSLLKSYDNPPLHLLEFVKEITDRHCLYSQSVDVFETDRGFLVNEMQCIFGQSDPYQMLMDGKPGRYVKFEDSWFFEEGDFNTNECYDLRLQTAIELYHSGKL